MTRNKILYIYYIYLKIGHAWNAMAIKQIQIDEKDIKYKVYNKI